jgi:hypothetical protein
MAIVKHYICDRCGAECKQEPGKFALYDIAFYTGAVMDGDKPRPKVMQNCKECFDSVMKFATTPPTVVNGVVMR